MRFDTRARRWVEHAVPGHTVLRAARVRGGVSSVVHRVRVVDQDRTPSTVMLRRVPRKPEVPDHDPELEIVNESRVLSALAGRARAPKLIAADATGSGCGVPALISSWLPGRPVVVPADRARWITGLAAAIDAVPASLPGAAAIPPFAPWHQPDAAPPEWSRRPNAWEQALDALRAELPPHGPHRLVHRDLHPGNVLFSRGQLSGIVDWTNASIGPAEVDISRCRVEIALLTDIETADAFLSACRPRDGYHPMWDALVACELGYCLDDLLEFNALGATLTLSDLRSRLDALVARAVDN